MIAEQAAYNAPPVESSLLEGDLIRPDDPRFGVIWANPKRLGGVPCFLGTRVPVQALFDYVAMGETINDFLDGFPPITREHVLAVLELAKSGLLGNVKAGETPT